MAYKEYREMKVYEQSGYQYKPTPAIVLKGKWLEELGFVSGTPVVVKCQGGQLTITPPNSANPNSFFFVKHCVGFVFIVEDVG